MWARLAGNAQSRSWICRELSPAPPCPQGRGQRREKHLGGRGAPGPKPRAQRRRPSPDDQRPQGLGPALPSPQSPCPCTSLLTTGPSTAPARRFKNSHDSQIGPWVAGFETQAGLGPRSTEMVYLVLNKTSIIYSNKQSL